MKQRADRGEKVYYRICEIADMFDVNESLLRYWEKEFPQIQPKTNGRGVRFYTKDDIKSIGLIYHLVKERGMTLAGARQKLKDNKEETIRKYEIVSRLQAVREQLVAMSKELDDKPEKEV
jgi:DNA-binding transcriptional MerR regulator